MIPYFVLTGFIALLSTASEAAREFYCDKARPSVPRVLSAGGVQARATQGSPRRSWTVFDYVAVAALIVFSALRFEVGTDYLMYARRFVALDPTTWAEQLAAVPEEPGFTALSLALRNVTESPHLLFWAMSVLTVVPVYVTIKKQSLDPTMSLILYICLAFFVSPFNIMRQGVAISLTFWANSFIDRNKLVYVSISALAASFHASALIAIVIQFVLRNARPTKRKAIIGMILAAAATATASQLAFVTTFLNGFNDRYDGYLGVAAAGVGTYLLIASRAALLIYAMRAGQSELAQRYGMYVLVGLAFLVVGTQSVPVARMELYFGIFLILLVPNQLHGHKDAGVHKALIYACGLIFYFQYLANWGGLNPYRTYLFG